ncbi:MAG: aspartate kinase [Candidatus Coatesbacteria bacterium]|nr:aspartate kinase [Candidatus Coatesbacteria bacterium]
MPVIIHKYGGTSLGEPYLIKKNAERVADCAKKGNSIVVVVSAMGKSTDNLISLANEVSKNPNPRELDMLISVGERITMALFAMALNDLGLEAISFTGSQSGIITDTRHNNAHIIEIRAFRIKEALEQGKIVIVAGFQGVSVEKEVTTLGRGGSDLTAIALAAYLGASECDIFTDVEGVYTADPRTVKSARKLEKITTDEMLELANLGAKVMYSRAMLLAEKYRIPIHLRSSFIDEAGTIITQKEQGEKNMEEPAVHAITNLDKQAMISIYKINNSGNYVPRIFEELADKDINIDIIIHNSCKGETSDLSFTIAEKDTTEAEKIIKQIITSNFICIDKPLTKISLVGLGMSSYPGIAAILYGTLSKVNINTYCVATTEIKISILVKETDSQLAIEMLHRAFNLDKIEKESGFPIIQKS